MKQHLSLIGYFTMTMHTATVIRRGSGRL